MATAMIAAALAAMLYSPPAAAVLRGGGSPQPRPGARSDPVRGQSNNCNGGGASFVSNPTISTCHAPARWGKRGREMCGVVGRAALTTLETPLVMANGGSSMTEAEGSVRTEETPELRRRGRRRSAVKKALGSTAISTAERPRTLAEGGLGVREKSVGVAAPKLGSERQRSAATEGLGKNIMTRALNRKTKKKGSGDATFFEEFSSKSRLLSKEEEFRLGKLVQRYHRLNEGTEQLEKELGREPTIKETCWRAGMSEVEFNQALSMGSQARERMIVCNLALVVSIASRYRKASAGRAFLKPLIQEGSLGLMRAVDLYDPSRGWRFSTYATWWIDCKIRVAADYQDRCIYIPQGVRAQQKWMVKAFADFQKSLQREPTAWELSQMIFEKHGVSLSPERLSHLALLNANVESLDREIGKSSEEDFTMATHLESTDKRFEVGSEWNLFRDHLEMCMKQDLSDLQRTIVRMRVGMEEERVWSRREICETLKMTMKGVLVEEKLALSKLGKASLAEFQHLAHAL